LPTLAKSSTESGIRIVAHSSQVRLNNSQGIWAIWRKATPWVHHLMTHLYSSIAYALANNKRLLTESLQEFCDFVKSLRTGSFPCSDTGQARHILFPLKKAARMVHHSKHKFVINLSMREEIEFFHNKLNPKLTIRWETPISHLIPRTLTATAFEDS